jgi:hypothetical protein
VRRGGVALRGVVCEKIKKKTLAKPYFAQNNTLYMV